MELLQLKYFLKVAETQSMSRAAEEIHISQPALSGSIKRLEDELGYQLFDRVGRNIFLNARGALFARGIRKALGELDATTDALGALSAHNLGVISLGIFVPDVYARECIVEFADANPGVSFEINGRQEGPEAIRNDPYDLVFFSEGAEFSGFESVTVALDRLGVVVPSAHRLANRESVSLIDLCGESFGLLSDSDHDIAVLINAFCNEHPDSSVRFRCNSLILLRRLVAKGLCLGIVREGYHEEYVADERCCYLALEDAWCGQRVQFGYRPDAELSPPALSAMPC